MSQKTFNEDKEYGDDLSDIEQTRILYEIQPNHGEKEINEKFEKLFKIAENQPKVLAKLKTHQKKLLHYLNQEEIDEKNESTEDYNAQNNPDTQIGNWWQNQVLAQSNKKQADKAILRYPPPVQIFDNNHVYMKREQLGINQTSQIPYVQGQMNPTLRNVVTQKYTISSSNREHLYKHSPFNIHDASHDDLTLSTDFMLDLPEPLRDVVSIKLDSISIPYYWYNFDPVYGNTCLYCDGSLVEIPGGHYTAAILATKINNNSSACFTISYSAITGKMDFSMTSPSPPFPTLYFYSEDGSWNCPTNNCKDYTKKNQNLGWDLGFKYDLDASGVFKYTPNNGNFYPPYTVNTQGPTFFLLSIDDFNQNWAPQQNIYTGSIR